MFDSLSLLSAYYPLSRATAAPGTGAAFVANLAAAQTASAALGRELEDDKVRISGLAQLLSAVFDFQGAIGGLQTAAAVNPAVATSSDATVATAAAAADAQLGSYDVVVSQLAAAQTAESGAFADSDTTVVGTGTLHIQLGTLSGGSFTPGAAPAVDVTVTDGTLDGIAAAVNAAGAGVTASVVEDANGFHLVLRSDDTGTAAAFEVSATDDDGDDTDDAGLSRLTFDHASGGRLTQTQAAQDANYTVDGIAAVSTGNGGVSAAPGVTLTLLKTGSTTVTVVQDVGNVQAAAQKLVDAYNSLTAAVGGLTASAGPLPENGIAGDILSGVDRILGGSFAGAAPSTLLSEIGIARQADGTLALDTATLQTAFNTDADAATALINQAATDLDDFAETFTRTGGTIANATQRLQQQVAFLGGRASGADFALSVLQRQAARQYAAVLALSLGLQG